MYVYIVGWEEAKAFACAIVISRRALFGHTFGGQRTPLRKLCSAFCHFSFFIHLSIQHLSFSFGELWSF